MAKKSDVKSEDLLTIATDLLGPEDDPSIKYWLPTGSLLLDLAIHNGLPGGKLIELYGDPGKGKTLIALSICRQAQLLGGTAIYLDAEAAVSANMCKSMLGIDITRRDNWIYRMPANLDEGLAAVEQLALACKDKTTPTVIVLDSIPALTTIQQGMDESNIAEDKKVTGANAAKISWFFSRGILRKLAGSNVYLVFINQVRDNMDFFTYGKKEPTTPGGKSLKFFSSTRVEVSQVALKDIEEKTIGALMVLTVKKNRHGPPNRQALIPLYYKTGMDETLSQLNYLIQQKVFERKGAYLEFGGQRMFKKEWRELVNNDGEWQSKLGDLCRTHFTTT